jgi:uncharacterized membrane protein YhhN
MSKRKVFISFFLITTALNLAAMAFGWPVVNFITKPLIIVSLIAFYVSSAGPAMNRMIVLALGFCWVGDVLLLLHGQLEASFILGLAAFLIGHLIYVAAYRQLQRKATKDQAPLSTRALLGLLPVVIAIGLVVLLFPGLGGLKFPVIAYSAAITWMVLTALMRNGRTNSKSFWMIFGGAFIFMISDSLLAINKFYTPIPLPGLWIMITYCTAQYLIVRGALAYNVVDLEG